MNYIYCTCCGYDDTELVNQGPDLYLNRPGDFRLVRCKQCGLIYQNPQLTAEELRPFYPEVEYELYSKDIKTKAQLFDKTHGMVRRCNEVIKYAPQPGKLLDVGCATGAFLATMRDRQWQVIGVEPSIYASTYAREVVGLDVRTGTLEETQFADGEFTAVTLWDVFEHLPAPQKTLTEITRILQPNGLLVISIPNPMSLEASVFGSAWAGWDRPRHLHLFPPRLLHHCLEKAGFGPIHVNNFSGRLRVTLLSLEYWFTKHGIPKQKWLPWIQRSYNLPFRILTWPFYRLAERLNQTTNMTIFAYYHG